MKRTVRGDLRPVAPAPWKNLPSLQTLRHNLEILLDTRRALKGTSIEAGDNNLIDQSKEG